MKSGASFVILEPKLMVLPTKRATFQKWAWAPNIAPFSKTEFVRGGPNEKVVAQGIVVICPIDKNHDHYTKIDFWPQISKFLGQKSTFSPLAANWSLTDQCFQHEKGVSLDSRYEGTKSFTPSPKKLDFWPQNGQIWPKTGILGQTSAFLAHLI